MCYLQYLELLLAVTGPKLKRGTTEQFVSILEIYMDQILVDGKAEFILTMQVDIHHSFGYTVSFLKA